MKRIIVASVVALPVEERLRLVEATWDSIAEVPDEVPLTAEEAAELERRLADDEKNPGVGSPWAEARERLERGIDGQRGGRKVQLQQIRAIGGGVARREDESPGLRVPPGLVSTIVTAQRQQQLPRGRYAPAAT